MLAAYWHVPALVLGVIALAFFVNRFAPDKRNRVRRCVILLAFTLVLLGGQEILKGEEPWRLRLFVGSEIVEAFLVINLAATTFFDLILPKTRVRLASIASDLTVGAAYIVTTVGILASAGLNPASVVATMTGEMTLGSTCSAMMRRGPAPIPRAASTYSRSRTESVAPRTRRATVVQPNSAIRTTMR